MPQHTIRIDGSIINRNGVGVPSLRVDAWDEDLLFDDFLGSAVTDSTGRFFIEISEDRWRECLADRRPDLFFRVFSGTEQVADTSDSVLWNLKDGDEPVSIVVDLDVETKEPEGEPGRFIVKGRLLDQSGNLVPNAWVRAFDKGLRSEQPMGETTADSAGAYQIAYTRERFRRAGKRSADLIVRAFDPDTGTLPLAQSDPVFNARPIEVVDLKVTRVVSEYERYTALLEPVRDGVAIERLTAEDIDFLAKQTGIDPQHLSLLQNAAELARKTKIPAQAFYALARQDLPAELPKLLELDSGRRREALEEAIDGHIVPARLGDGLDQVLERLDQLAQTVPEVRRNREQDDLRHLAALSGIGGAKVDAVLREVPRPAALDHAAVISLVASGELTENDTKSLGLSVSLYNLFDANAGLAAGFRERASRRLPEGKISRISDLAELERNDWIDTLRETGVEPRDGLDIETYADRLSKRIERRYPSKALWARLRPVETRELKERLEGLQPLLERNGNLFGIDGGQDLNLEGIDDETLISLRLGYGLLQRFVNRYPGLRIHEILDDRRLAPAEKERRTSERIDLLQRFRELNPNLAFLALDYSVDSSDIPTLNFTGLEDRERSMVLANLKANQSIYRETRDAGLTRRFLEGGYRSPASIATDSVKNIVSATGVDLKAAGEIKKSSKVSTVKRDLTTLGLIEAQKSMFVAFDPSLSDYLRKFPGWEEMFGNLAYCHCRHCRSILSPAAYFVDLMRFVETQILCDFDFPQRSISVPLPIPPRRRISHPLYLRQRRPDLWTLPLTCEHSNGMIPALVIVNEVLENYIAVIHLGWDLDQLPVPGTDRSEIERDVYRALSQSVRSFRQPFTLPLEELATYLGHFDLTRGQVTRLIASAYDGDTNDVVAAAVVGLSKHEYRLITQPETDIDRLQRVYGLSFDEGPDGIEFRIAETQTWERDAHVLLTAMGLTREQLGEMIRTYFVLFGAQTQPATRETVWIESEKLDEESVQNDVERIHGLTVTALDRLHRFTRLWRSLPWSIEELDLALLYLVKAELATSLDAGTLRRLSEILSIQRRFGCTVEDLCALWGEIPRLPIAGGEESRFDRLFNPSDFVRLDGALPRGEHGFLHPAFRTTPADPEEIDQSLHRLLAGLRVDNQALYALITALAKPLGELDLESESPNDKRFALTAENLSMLYRHARLAEWLGLSVRQLFQLIRLSQNAGTIRATLRGATGYVSDLQRLRTLLEYYDWWKTTGYSLDDLELLVLRRETVVEAPRDATVIVGNVLEKIEKDQALTFSDTVFAFLEGITEAQSRQIIAANLGAVIEVPGAGYRVAPSFDPETDSIPRIRELESLGIDRDALDSLRDGIENRLREHHGPGLPPFGSDFLEGVEGLAGDRPYTAIPFLLGAIVKAPGTRYRVSEGFVSTADPASTLNLPADLLGEPAGDPNAVWKRLCTYALPGAPVFDDTLFATIDGIAEHRSREIVRLNPELIEPVPQDRFRLTVSFDSSAPLTIPEGIPVHRDDAVALLHGHHARELLPAYLAQEFGLPVARMKALIAVTGVDLSDPDLAITYALGHSDPHGVLLRLIQALIPLSILFAPTAFDEDAIRFVAGNPDLFDRLQLHAQDGETFSETNIRVSIDAMRLLSIYRSLLEKTTGIEGALQALLSLLRSFNATTQRFYETSSNLQDDLACVLNVEKGVAVTAHEEIPLPASALAALDRLVGCIALAKRMGVGAETLRLIVSNDYVRLDQAANAVLGAFRARYEDEEEWLSIVEPFQDKIRTRKRDALTDHLLHAIDPQLFGNANDLYHYFLIDTQLEGCARTSRVVSANLTLQLYVQRVEMHLEQDVAHELEIALDADGVAEWEWRKNYRVWEANRKVFLFPENYVYPDLRDNKTPLFAELEQNLLSQEINDDNVLESYSRYMRGFDEISKLRIAGSYHRKRSLCVKGAYHDDILHLFAVSGDGELSYFYRTVENLYCSQQAGTAGTKGVLWHPWRKIGVQVPVEKVSPVIFRRRLYLFWVEINTRPLNDLVAGESKFVGYKHTMTLKYSMLRHDGSWTAPKKIPLDTQDEPPFIGGEGVVEDLFFSPRDHQYGHHFYVSETSFPKRVTVTPRYGARENAHATPYFVVEESDCGGCIEARFEESLESYSFGVPNQPMEGFGVVLCETITTLEERLRFGFQLGLGQLGRDYLPVDYVKPRDGYTLNGYKWDRIYPFALGNELFLSGRDFKLQCGVDLYRGILFSGSRRERTSYNGSMKLIRKSPSAGKFKLKFGKTPYDEVPQWDRYAYATAVLDEDRMLEEWNTATDFRDGLNKTVCSLEADEEISAINKSPEDWILESNAETLLLQGSVRNGSGRTAEYLLRRLGTTLGEELGRRLSAAGVEGLLDTDYQLGLQEASIPEDKFRELYVEIDEPLTTGKLEYEGPYGVYFREIWFHIPFLVADCLNGQQKFAEAQKWYHHIFDPTARSNSTEGWADDSKWRYAEFRGRGDLMSLRQQLTQPSAIEAYKRDPFNPHAIARLRPGAYEKAIVMRYIDNLLDWGDHLFAKDTMESINEATLLYVLAADILGDRPPEIGDCGEVEGETLDWQTIAGLGLQENEFLLEMDLVANEGVGPEGPWPDEELELLFPDALSEEASDDGSSPVSEEESRPTLPDLLLGGQARYPFTNEPPAEIPKRGLLFCIPVNDELLGYWDRVEDRLFKIRNCMNIGGVRRELALFAPEIDPMLLVRAKAAGLSLDDILSTVSGNLPPYRFNYVIERAKGYAQSLQGFGAALLSAIEKRDIEKLNLLRAAQQQEILRLSDRIRAFEIQAAKESHEALLKRKETEKYRRQYFQDLLDLGLTGWESAQRRARHASSLQRLAAAGLDVTAAILHLIPGVGSPFAMKYGGQETGQSAFTFAEAFRDSAAIFDAIAASAGLEAGFERREQGWEHQVTLADHELDELEKQIAASNIRVELAIRASEIHEKTIEQVEEIYDHYNSKFTNLGLYTWLSTTLQRLYRDAYNNAYAMAKLAEQAYRFERGDDAAELIGPNHWDASKAGLLAGEQLLMDLQNLERRYLETNYRGLEIDQSFSLTQIAPDALVQLKETGVCELQVPELFFDLVYPGHYRRRVKAVRLTIPCITGPYTNVGATLSLLGSCLRNEPKLDARYLLDVPVSRTTTIATSTAQNDAGVFELNFRDERYMPFEGAGAVSKWKLSLPRTFRPFDYQTINDVILHISYTAEEDGALRDQVESELDGVQRSILQTLSDGQVPLSRIISLRQELSNELHRLLHGIPGTSVAIEISDKHFPFFLRGRALTVAKLIVVLRIPELQGCDGVEILLNDKLLVGEPTGEEAIPLERDQETSRPEERPWGGLPYKVVHLRAFSIADTISPDESVSFKIAFAAGGALAPPEDLTPPDRSVIDSGKLTDIMLYVEYRLAPAAQSIA